MGTLVFQANLGGAVNLIGPNTASTVNFTLPSADGTSGQALVTNGSGTLSFSTFTSGAAGSNTQVQFNSSGAFAGSSNLTFNGTTLTAANTSVTTSETLSYGTANGVAYLNGSKVVTTGSALTFDGSNLGVGTSPLAARVLSVKGRAAFTALANDSQIAIYSDGSTNGIYSTYNSTGSYLPMTFYINDAEQMRLTSTGLGIGTSSPAYKLAVQGSAYITSTVGIGNTPGNYGGQVEIYTNANSANNGIWVRNDSAGSSAKAGIVLNASGNSWRMSMGSTANNSNALTWELDVSAPSTKMTLDSSGNLGLGVTPSAWQSGRKVLQVGYSSMNSYSNSQIQLGANFYYDGTNNKYISSDFSTVYQQLSGQHQWYTSASGTAGNAISFTQAMTLDASGNLNVGGTTSTGGYRAAITGVGTAGNPIGGIVFRQSATDTLYLGSIQSDNTTDVEMWNPRNGFLRFATNNTERARIDSQGNLLVGKTSSDPTVAGCELSVNGGIFTRASDALLVNRQGSDGTAITIRRSNTTVGTISVTTTATAYNTSSDYRLKNIDGPLTDSGVFIDALKPKVGTWKADGSKFVGFLAHEVQEVSPGSVVGEKDGEQMQAMEYGSAEFIANIVAELQSLRARVAQLEGK